MTALQKEYFDNMRPGAELKITQVKNPAVLIAAGKEYIDLFGTLVFNDDYTKVTKLHEIPKDGNIRIFIGKKF